jgi:hypothetical protein
MDQCDEEYLNMISINKRGREEFWRGDKRKQTGRELCDRLAREYPHQPTSSFRPSSRRENLFHRAAKSSSHHPYRFIILNFDEKCA